MLSRGDFDGDLDFRGDFEGFVLSFDDPDPGLRLRCDERDDLDDLLDDEVRLACTCCWCFRLLAFLCVNWHILPALQRPAL